MRGQLIQWVATMAVSMVVSCSHADALEIDFTCVAVQPRSRIDAIAHLGNGVVVAGSRGNNDAGSIFVSRDCGRTWRAVGTITDTDFITCVQSGGDGVGYVLTGRQVHVWKTTDYGEKWTDLGQVSTATSGNAAANAYGMVITREGTVLVADNDERGGHIHRSTDGGTTWRDIGCISPRGLYRLNGVGAGVMVNGWAGHVYKSTDDGVTWTDTGKLVDSPLYAIECVERDGTVLIAAENGDVFRSHDDCHTWRHAGRVGGAADDFAWLGKGHVLLSTYTGSRELYVSADSGASWERAGPVPSEPGDWLDHFICFPEHGARHLVGGTNKGWILYARLPE